jgi:hypothetical protein
MGLGRANWRCRATSTTRTDARVPPNGLRVSRAAPLDRDRSRATITVQKSSDLARRTAASATRAGWASRLGARSRLAHDQAGPDSLAAGWAGARAVHRPESMSLWRCGQMSRHDHSSHASVPER